MQPHRSYTYRPSTYLPFLLMYIAREYSNNNIICITSSSSRDRRQFIHPIVGSSSSSQSNGGEKKASFCILLEPFLPPLRLLLLLANSTASHADCSFSMTMSGPPTWDTRYVCHRVSPSLTHDHNNNINIITFPSRLRHSIVLDSSCETEILFVQMQRTRDMTRYTLYHHHHHSIKAAIEIYMFFGESSLQFILWNPNERFCPFTVVHYEWLAIFTISAHIQYKFLCIVIRYNNMLQNHVNHLSSHLNNI